MTQGATTEEEGRNCWRSARDRERRRARFHIQERVTQPLFAKNVLGTSSVELVVQYISYIKAGDRSKFSLARLNEDFDVLSTRIPIAVLDQPTVLQDNPPQSLKEHSLQLCTAWFGVDYATSLQSHLESLQNFTLMEYAAWMGKYSIVSGLLMAGVNPCVSSRRHTQKTRKEDWMATMGVQVHQSFWEWHALKISTYIVKRVVELRWAAGDALEESCQVCQGVDIPPLLFEECQHTICEQCFWQDIVKHVHDARGGYADVVVCPYCENHHHCKDDTQQRADSSESSEWDALLPPERCQKSLELFQSLPKDSHALKYSTRKKKKTLKTNSWAPSWNEAVEGSLGSSQTIRRDRFAGFLERKAIHFIRGCLVAGMDINGKNEYGQTPLYIATWRREFDIVQLLLDFGADVSLMANDGSTPLEITRALHHPDIYKLLKEAAGDHDKVRKESTDSSMSVSFPSHTPNPSQLDLSFLIPMETDHPGAAACTIENCLHEDQIEWLLRLHKKIPVDKAQKKKAGTCSERSYFCDAQGHMQAVLREAILQSTWTYQEVQVFAHMRFLNYSIAGTTLNPHVDICRVDLASGVRSTHTFILYLTDCETGGETSLLGDVSGEGRQDVLARIAPRRGRLLLFPHACPHEGNAVMDVPKILLRGEVLLTLKK